MYVASALCIVSQKTTLLTIPHFQYFKHFYFNLRANLESFVLNTILPTSESLIWRLVGAISSPKAGGSLISWLKDGFQKWSSWLMRSCCNWGHHPQLDSLSLASCDSLNSWIFREEFWGTVTSSGRWLGFVAYAVNNVTVSSVRLGETIPLYLPSQSCAAFQTSIFVTHHLGLHILDALIYYRLCFVLRKNLLHH